MNIFKPSNKSLKAQELEVEKYIKRRKRKLKKEVKTDVISLLKRRDKKSESLELSEEEESLRRFFKFTLNKNNKEERKDFFRLIVTEYLEMKIKEGNKNMIKLFVLLLELLEVKKNNNIFGDLLNILYNILHI